MSDTLTLMRLGIDGQPARTLGSANPCESMIEIVPSSQHNVKRCQDADKAQGAGPLPGCSPPGSGSAR